jgi:hypothetical protein
MAPAQHAWAFLAHGTEAMGRVKTVAQFCITDSAGGAVVMGSACRCTTCHLPSSSGLRIIVERTAYGVTSSRSPILASARSSCTT